MMLLKRAYFSIRDSVAAAYVAAALGGLVYFLQAWNYAHTQTLLVDEGGYLYSGLLFARGLLRPFQDNGLIRIYAPLSSLVPGTIEAWFGAGVRTGRYFSVLCSLVMLAVLWSTSRRLGGKWWAAGVVWAMVLTPISIQIYSLAITEALVACLIACSLALVLGGKRSTWQVFAGSVLAGLAVMTRQNVAPLIPLLAAYIFWQHGKRAGGWAVGGCLLPIVILHAIYWPNILELWAVWLPARLTPFLDAYRVTSASLGGATGIGFMGRMSAFLLGIRFHYFTMVGFCVCLFLWPRRDGWRDPADKKMASFLAALFVSLALIHAWATFIINSPAVSCAFCFTPYLAFFDVIIFLLIIVTVPSWRKSVSKIRLAVIILFVILLYAGIGYASFDRLGTWVLTFRFPAFIRGWNPQDWTPFITLQGVLANKYHLDFWNNRAPVAAVFGLLIGMILLVLLAWLWLTRKGQAKGYSFGAFLLMGIFTAGIFVSPLLGGAYRDKGLCRADILKISEQIGGTMRETLPEDSLTYWGADNAVPLLYAPDRPIHLPQIYALFFFRSDGDPERLLQHGFWNTQLSEQWLDEAAFIVAGSNWRDRPDYPGDGFLANFTQTRTVPANPCDPNSYFVIYQKKP